MASIAGGVRQSVVLMTPLAGQVLTLKFVSIKFLLCVVESFCFPGQSTTQKEGQSFGMRGLYQSKMSTLVIHAV